MAKKKAKQPAARIRGNDEAEAFFRPFAKIALKKPEPAAKDTARKGPGKGDGASGAAADKGASKAAAPARGAPSAGSAASTPAAAKLAPARPARAASEAPIAPVDPDTFAIYMAGVKALEGGRTRIPLTASRLERATTSGAPPADPDAAARAQMRSLVSEGIRFETTDDGEHVEGRRLDVDPRELRFLRRGRYAVDGKLDLHGLSLIEAREAVEAFVRKRATDGDKVVVIVHGKGTHSPRQLAVLRGEIGAWLSQGRASRVVRAFTTAPSDEGGGGAVLVMLGR